jgi:Na+/citrate or Na+/malate symporter
VNASAATTDAPIGRNGFAAPPPRVGEPDQRQWSRTRAGVTSFGLFGRIVITVIAVLMLGIFAMNLPFGLVGIGLWLFVVLPMLLRDVWKRERIR